MLFDTSEQSPGRDDLSRICGAAFRGGLSDAELAMVETRLQGLRAAVRELRELDLNGEPLALPDE